MSEPKVYQVGFSGVDFLEGISDLDDAVQVAVYTVVFATIYARNGPIANDARWINRSAKCRYVTTCRAALDALLAKGKLYLTEDGLLMNARSERALARARHNIRGLKNTGRAPGEHRESTARPSRATRVSANSNGLADTHDGFRPDHEVLTNTSTEPIQSESLTGGRGARDAPTATEPELFTATSKPDGARHGRRLPEDWQPTPDLIRYAEDRALDPSVEADAFADYWRAESGQRASKRDWSAAFRTWCRRSAGAPGGRRPPAAARAASGGGGLDAFARGAARMADEIRRRR